MRFIAHTISLIFTIILWGGYYYCHFADVETEPESNKMACPSHTASKWQSFSLAWASHVLPGSFNYVMLFFKVVSSLSLYSKKFSEHTELVDSSYKKQETTFLNSFKLLFQETFWSPHPAVVRMRGILVSTLNICTSA